MANVISDLSPDPWRLNDFTAYLSRNHCLENLQFVQDASRYRACYVEIVGGNRISRVSLTCHFDYLQALWEDILGAYIFPNGHREVNLPSEVRDRLLKCRSSDFLPHPSELDDAVKVVYELIEDSILPGFLNSHVSLEQPGERERGDGRRIRGRLRRNISTSISECDHQIECLGGDGRGTLCARRHSLGGPSPSPRTHLLRRALEVFDHTVHRVRGKRWLKPLLEKDEATDVEIGTRDHQYVSAKSLE
ncbi:RGS domain-containing protein [Thelonectria olida]|uniref:RGS domain-containing protein n=1 Tax=Thelonectria olida TaxID=1576542 RepID=A0A9P8VVB2_9HYPO|nr:RGS domain-containing protein [Thelonectria olida]